MAGSLSSKEIVFSGIDSSGQGLRMLRCGSKGCGRYNYFLSGRKAK
jgi:hypothetical protein